MFKSLLARLQIVLPTMLLTRVAGVLAESRIGWLKNTMIRLFSSAYAVNWEETEASEANDFASFNDFFCRPLRADARLLQRSAEQLLSPCDGLIGACGRIDSSQQLLQAKHITYPLPQLLGCPEELSSSLCGHHYYTLYLAPHNYHRVHMPLAGRLQQCCHVPGRLFSVAPASTTALAGIFCRNERVVCWFVDAQQRPWVMVLVGAMMVGSIATVWHGRYGHRNGAAVQQEVLRQAVQLEQGDEMGRFLMGSTVIVLAPFAPDPAVSGSIRLHQPLSL
ncbi:MAG: archaetidylserine decarboxylase [Wenzhouxiangellaceae bacterium]